MVAAQLGEALVEGDGDQVPIMRHGGEGAAEDRLDLEGGAHPSEREVPEPQLVVGQLRGTARVFERHIELTRHGCDRWGRLPWRER